MVQLQATETARRSGTNCIVWKKRKMRPCMRAILPIRRPGSARETFLIRKQSKPFSWRCETVDRGRGHRHRRDAIEEERCEDALLNHEKPDIVLCFRRRHGSRSRTVGLGSRC